MDVRKVVVINKSFTFTSEEAAVLRDVLFTKVDWEGYRNCEFVDFFEGLFSELADVEYGEPS